MKIVGATAAAAATPVATETASIVFAALSAAIQTVTVAGRTITSDNSGYTAAQVAQVMSGGAAVTGLTLSGALNGWTAAVTSTSTAVFTSITPAANVLNITASATVGTAPAVTTTEGSAGAALTTATAVPVLTSIENVVFTAAGNGVTYSAVGVAGVTGVQFDAAAGAANTVTVSTGQSVTLSNTAVTNNTTIAGNTPTTLTLNLNKVGAVSGTTDTVTLSGTALTTLNINSTGAASKITLATAVTPLATLNITGDQGVSIIEQMNTLVTINASTATGAVSIDKTGATTAATFAFTGGSANDTLKLNVGDLALFTSGAQLNGGAGTGDKLVTLDTTFAATDYAKINATVGFEVLGTGAAAAVVDAAQLTTIKSFAIDGDGIQAYTNLATGSTFAITAAHAATIGISTATGVSDVAIAVGTATTAGLAIAGTVTLAGATTVALSSNGTNAAANVITTLTNVVNSNVTITGSNDLTITNGLVGTLGATGSAVNAAAFTGKLVVTGSGAGDIITGGSGVDTITGGQGSDIVTGGAGADIFVFSGAAAANTSGVVFGQADVITDFVVGIDKLQFSTVTEVVSGEQVAVQAAVTALAAGSTATQIATAMATASTTALGVSVATFGGNTYVLYETTAGAGAVGVAANDVFIQLTGVASGVTFANSVIV